jgi:hypothetical protein
MMEAEQKIPTKGSREMPPTRPGEIVLGDHRTTPAGKLEIKAERKWIPYPRQATELIDMAHAHGWGTDNGLPVRHTTDGTIYIRILVGRERGHNALTGTESMAAQFHLTWVLNHETWETGPGYVKVGIKKNAWRGANSADARKMIAGNPVTLPSVYADEKEMAC